MKQHHAGYYLLKYRLLEGPSQLLDVKIAVAAVVFLAVLRPPPASLLFLGSATRTHRVIFDEMLPVCQGAPLWTKMSFSPLSCTMKPKPFLWLKNLTTPLSVIGLGTKAGGKGEAKQAARAFEP